MSQQLSQLRHAYKRGRTYYTNFKLNASPRYIRLSLGTDSLKQAEVIMNQIRPYIPLVQNGTMPLETFKLKMQGYREVTKQDFDNYLLRTLEMSVEEVERLPQLGKFHKAIFPDSPLSPSATVEDAQGYDQAHRNRMYSGSEQTANEVLASLSLDKLELTENDLPLANEVAGEIDMSRATVAQAYSAFYSGDLSRYRHLVNDLKKRLSEASHKVAPPPAPALPEAPAPTVENAIKLSEAWKMYVRDKGEKWRRPVANENDRFFAVLLHVVGDLPVNLVTKAHIREALDVAENLPRRNNVPYSGMTLEECIAYDIPEEDLIASQHVGKHLKIWRSLFKTFLVDAKDLLDKAPTDGVRYKVKPNRRGHYTEIELRRLQKQLFASPDSDVCKWYFLTLIYTGARRSEIAAIRKEHIRKDEESQRYYIFIEDGKTEHAMRKIPINRAIEAGLLQRIDSLKDKDLVFGDLPDETPTTNRWIDLMRKCDVPDYNEFGLKRRLHSCRHSFVTLCLAAQISEPLMQVVVGHARSKSLGISAEYFRETSLKPLLCVVDFLQWD